MGYKIKEGVSVVRTKSSNILHSLELFIEASALIYAPLLLYLALMKKVDLNGLNVAGRYAAYASILVIAYLGAIQFVKFLDR